MLKVLVSQRVEWIEARGEMRDALDQRLIEWLLQVGVLAIPVPNALQPRGALNSWLSNISPHAVILSGGNDIGVIAKRDETEIALLQYAELHDLPALGICRGMQMLAKHAGGELIRVRAHTGTRHSLNVLKPCYKLPFEVNSYHDWAVEHCPPSYEILATTQDGILEAMRHKNLSWEGWMWHPEREIPFNNKDVQRARNILKLDY